MDGGELETRKVVSHLPGVGNSDRERAGWRRISVPSRIRCTHLHPLEPRSQMRILWNPWRPHGQGRWSIECPKEFAHCWILSIIS